MQRDIRDTAAFDDARRLFAEIYKPGEAWVSDIADLQRSADPLRLLFVGTLIESLDHPVITRICEFDLTTRSHRVLTLGPNSDRHPRLCSDGKTVAFLSDRRQASDFQLFFLDIQTLAVTAAPAVAGWVEYLQWSPDGRRILLGVAGHGAELSSGQGATKTSQIATDEPSWLPQVMTAVPDALWRKAWIYDVATAELSLAFPEGCNIWEASWLGDDKLAVVTSNEPGEGSWYSAELAIIDLGTGAMERVYKPAAQIAWPRACPSGRYLAFIEAISSDREYVAGDLRLVDLHDHTCRLLATDQVDTTYVEWQLDDDMLVAGHRGLDTIVLRVGLDAGHVEELWRSTMLTTVGRYASVLGLPPPGDFAFVCEGFFERPHIATVKGGVLEMTTPAGLEQDDSDHAETVRWQAPDGLPIEGWLLKPAGKPPYATIMEVHGGPVLAWRPFWLGRAVSTLMLLRRGYAIFFPNPRGSSGRGQAFAAQVVGDVGGADTTDYLSGVDHLINAGVADPLRLGVTGLSYGGFMTCWLTTQDPRFRAAIAVGPATNHVSHHLSCNIPQFVRLFVQDHYTDLAGRYYSRSPILQAHRSDTPTLLVAGDRDRCTPAAEALQFHNALLENGVDTVLVRYPEEGHGVQAMPAAMDYGARCVMWFERYIPPVDTALERRAENLDQQVETR